MSIMNVILLSITPIAALGMLLGLGRFEKWALEDRPARAMPTGSLDLSADAAVEAVASAMDPAPVPQLHQAA